MVRTHFVLVVGTAVVVVWLGLAHAADYHHVHLAAPNTEEAAQWYITHMGCQALSFRKGRLSVRRDAGQLSRSGAD